jgi:hypothetical protein
MKIRLENIVFDILPEVLASGISDNKEKDAIELIDRIESYYSDNDGTFIIKMLKKLLEQYMYIDRIIIIEKIEKLLNTLRKE